MVVQSPVFAVEQIAHDLMPALWAYLHKDEAGIECREEGSEKESMKGTVRQDMEKTMKEKVEDKQEIEIIDSATAMSQQTPYPKIELLRKKLRAVSFHTTTAKDALISLIYEGRVGGHDDSLNLCGERDNPEAKWVEAARELQKALGGVQVVGRWKGKVLAVDRAFVKEQLRLLDGERVMEYKQPLGSFSNPNGHVNILVLDWLERCLDECVGTCEGRLLLEMYSGYVLNISTRTMLSCLSRYLLFILTFCAIIMKRGGNHTKVLGSRFSHLVCVELDGTLCSAARENCAGECMKDARLSVVQSHCESFSKRVLRVLGDKLLTQGVALVDPPRAGLDPSTITLVSRFEWILYISCNPTKLEENLAVLKSSHEVVRVAAFDAFALTRHLEVACLLRKRFEAIGRKEDGNNTETRDARGGTVREAQREREGWRPVEVGGGPEKIILSYAS